MVMMMGNTRGNATMTLFETIGFGKREKKKPTTSKVKLK
jgi:hypothetical protein